MAVCPVLANCEWTWSLFCSFLGLIVASEILMSTTYIVLNSLLCFSKCFFFFNKKTWGEALFCCILWVCHSSMGKKTAAKSSKWSKLQVHICTLGVFLKQPGSIPLQLPNVVSWKSSWSLYGFLPLYSGLKGYCCALYLHPLNPVYSYALRSKLITKRLTPYIQPGFVFQLAHRSAGCMWSMLTDLFIWGHNKCSCQ